MVCSRTSTTSARMAAPPRQGGKRGFVLGRCMRRGWSGPGPASGQRRATRGGRSAATPAAGDDDGVGTKKAAVKCGKGKKLSHGKCSKAKGKKKPKKARSASNDRGPSR